MPSFVPSLAEGDLREVLEHAEPAFRALDGARLFVTGGTGFFGMWLLESLAFAREALAIDLEAVALTRDPDRFARKAPQLIGQAWLSFQTGDVRSLEPGGERFSHVVHAATDASATLNRERPGLQLESVIEGTRRTLALAERAGAERLLFTSSGAVYGPQPPSLRRVPETYPGAPDPMVAGSAYGEGKRAAELMCVLSPVPAVVARCFAFVGPYLPLDGTYAVGNFVRDGLAGETIRVGGDGTPFRSYLYGTDLAIWLWTLLIVAPTERAYNVGSADDVSIGDLARRVAAQIDPAPRVEIAKAPDPGATVSRYVPEVARAEQELGLKVRVPLDEALRRTVAWHRAR